MAFFDNFPTILYGNVALRNIILKSQFYTKVLNNYSAFYPYTVKEGERADMIAHDYYGDWEKEWVVYFSNQIVDPYFGWVLTQSQLKDYLTKKYGNVDEALTVVHHYVYNTSVEQDETEEMYKLDYKMDPVTWGYLPIEEKSYWKPVTIGQHEEELNEKKRSIRLLESSLVPQVQRELSLIFRK